MEPWRRGARVDVSEPQSTTMVFGVAEDVREGIPDRARTEQDMRVVALPEHAPLALPQPVEASSDAGRQPVHASPERPGPVALAEEVQMVALDRSVDDPKAILLTTRLERTPHPMELGSPAQRGQPAPELHRHMHDVAMIECLPRSMRDT